MENEKEKVVKDNGNSPEKPKPRRGRPPKKKAQSNPGSAVVKKQVVDITPEKPKPRRGRPPKKVEDTAATINDKQTEDAQVKADTPEKPKPRRGRPPKKTAESTASSQSEKQPVAKEESTEKPKPRRGRPPKKNLDNSTGEGTSQSIRKTGNSNENPRSQRGVKPSRAAERSKQSLSNPKLDDETKQNSADSGVTNRKSENETSNPATNKKSWIKTIDLRSGNTKTDETNNSAQEKTTADETDEDSRFNKMEYLEGSPNKSNTNKGRPTRNNRNKNNQSDNQSGNQSSQESGNNNRKSSVKPVVKKNVKSNDTKDVEDKSAGKNSDKKEGSVQQRGIRRPKNQSNKEEEKSSAKPDSKDSQSQKKIISIDKSSKTEQKENADKPTSNTDNNENKEKPTKNNNKQNNGSNNQSDKNKSVKKDIDVKKSNRENDNRNQKSNSSNKNNKQEQNQASINPNKEKKERAIYRYTPSVYSYQTQEVNSHKLMDDKERNNPFISSFLSKINQFMREKLYVDIDVKILIAVSGGIDSVVLTDALAILSQEYHFSFELAHYNHKMREGSDKDENFVRQLANSYRVPFHAGQGNVKNLASESGMSLEEAARHLRYGFLRKVTSKTKATFVATAHNANDSAETLLMNLMRGSGLTGLSGIPAKRQLDANSTLIRPFINITREEIEKYAKVRKLFWVEDITNRSLDFTRNKIRHEVIPTLSKEFNPKLIQTLHRTAQILRGADSFLKTHIIEHANLSTEDYSNGTLKVKKGIFNSFTDFVKGEILQYLINKHFDLQPLPSTMIDKIIDLTNQSIGAKSEVSKEIYAINERSCITITDGISLSVPETDVVSINGEGKYTFGGYEYQVNMQDSKNIKLKPDNDTEVFDVEYMPKTLTLRKWNKGDKIKPLGMNGSTLVSDFLTNNKIEPTERDNIAVIYDGIEVVWICGHRISDKYKINKNTNKVMVIQRKMIDSAEQN